MSDPDAKGGEKHHGGKRRGAGRPKKAVKVYDPDEAALKYLQDVAAGIEPPNRDRIAAARAVLPYQAPRKRAPVKSPRPADLQRQTDTTKRREVESDWNSKVVEIRTRMGRKEE